MSHRPHDSSSESARIEPLEDRRLLSAGDLDPAFGTGGKYLPADQDAPPAFILPTDFAVQADGKVVVSGLGIFDIGTVFRLTADGKIDPTFAGGNVLAGSGTGGQGAAATAVAVGANGRIVVGGVDGPFNAPPNAATLVVYKSDGTLDASFDGDGVIDTTAYGAGFADVLVQPDGKILALGKKLVRFNANGTPDKTFGGGDGVVDVSGRKLAIDSTGRITVLGFFALFRYKADGTPDASFDGDGIRPGVKGYDLALAPDGDVLVAGNGANLDQLSRFNGDGSPDLGFGHQGNVSVPRGITNTGLPLAVVATADDVFVGSSPDSPVIPFSDLTIYAYDNKGQPDAKFPNGGRIQTDVAWTRDHLVGLTLRQGKLLALGYADVPLNDAGSNTQSEPVLARYDLGAATPPGQTPFNGTPINVDDGVPVIQFDKGGEGVAYHDTDAANLGGAFRPDEGVDIQSTGDAFHPFVVGFVKAGEWLEYTVRVPAGGPYDIDFSVAHLKNGGKFHLEVDGANVTGPLTVPTTGSWSAYKAVTKRGVNLTVGTHVLRLAFDAAGDIGFVGNFDKIVFRRTSAPNPQQPFAGVPYTDAQTISSENFDTGGEGVAYHDTDAANLGGAWRNEAVDIQGTTEVSGDFNVGFVRPGEWLEYTIDFTQSGPFDLAVRLASQGSGGSFRVLIDGAAVATFAVTDTGGWQTYRTDTRSGINVAAGVHVVRFQADVAGPTGYVVNLNWFKFDKA